MINISEHFVVAIDQGNTLLKMALFQGIRLIKIVTLDKPDINNIANTFNEFENLSGNNRIEYAILSSVTTNSLIIHQALDSKVELIDFSTDLHLPVSVGYLTPKTLGRDRIAAVCGAIRQFPGFPVLSIDAGTCITYDLVTDLKEYLGGGISPGIQMRFKALHTFTGNLPLVEFENDPPLIGRTTHESILSGVINGIVQEVNGIIEQYMLNYPKLKIILTGGDAKYFDKKLKYNIFANPNLVLSGLRDIIIHHVEK